MAHVLTRSEKFIYQNTITGLRAVKDTGGGLKTDYSAHRFGELVPFVGEADPIPASIQAQRAGNTNPPGLPTDTPRSQWFILIPIRFAPRGTFRLQDTILDELGHRYTVTADYCGPLGWRLAAWKEEA